MPSLNNITLKDIFKRETFASLEVNFPSWILGKSSPPVMLNMNNTFAYFWLHAIYIVLSITLMLASMITYIPPILIFITLMVGCGLYLLKKIKAALYNLKAQRKKQVSSLRLLAVGFGVVLALVNAAPEFFIINLLFGPLLWGSLLVLATKYLSQLFMFITKGYTNTGIDSLPFSAWQRFTTEQQRRKPTFHSPTARFASFKSPTTDVTISFEASEEDLSHTIPLSLRQISEQITREEEPVKYQVGLMRATLKQLKNVLKNTPYSSDFDEMYTQVKEGNESKIYDYKSIFFLKLYHHFREKDLREHKNPCRERAIIADILGKEQAALDGCYTPGATPNTTRRGIIGTGPQGRRLGE